MVAFKHSLNWSELFDLWEVRLVGSAGLTSDSKMSGRVRLE